MKRTVGWVVGIVVVLALLVVGDRVAASVVAGQVAEGFEADGATDADVTISGFPFVTQLIGGELDEISGTAATARLTAGGDAGTDAPTELTVEDLRFTAHHVTTAEPRRAGDVTASALIPTTSLAPLISGATGTDLALATDGDALAVTGLGSVLGADLGVTVVPRADDGTLVVDVTALRLGSFEVSPDDLPDALAGIVTDRLDGLTVPLDLPEGVRIDSVRVQDDGVRVALSGADLELGTLAGS